MRRILIFQLAVALIVATQIGVNAQSSGPGRKLAFLVGVTEYDHDQLANLRFCENNVTDLNDVLKAQGYRTRILTSAASKDTPELAPTAANVRIQLKAFLKGATKRDLVLIGLAGHGLQLTGHHQNYFCPQDANPASQDGQFVEPETLVSIEEILQALENSGAGQKIVLIDACRNDPSARGKRGAIRCPPATYCGAAELQGRTICI